MMNLEIFKSNYTRNPKKKFSAPEKRNLRNDLSAGFALIELLIAMSIFAVVITIIHTTLYTGLKTYQRTQIELKINQEINQVLDKMSLELRNCYDAEYNNQTDVGGFIADSQGMSFFTIQNVYTQGSFKKLLARISYNYRDEKLFKKIQVDEDAFLEQEQFQEEELIPDIKELNFQYLYFKQIVFEGEDRYEWKPEWMDRYLVPQGIKIEITRYDPEEDISVSLQRYIFLAQGEIPTQQ